MSKGDLFAYFHRLLDRFMDQYNIPVKDKPKIKKELIAGLKEEFGVKHMSKLNAYDRWKFVYDCERTLITDYGYFPEDDVELKFKD